MTEMSEVRLSGVDVGDRQSIISAGAILADPAWLWVRYSAKGEGRAARNHYKDRLAMSIEEIKAYPVGEMAAGDCFLFLWAPSSFVTEVKGVMDAWGFKFSSKAFTWVKLTFGAQNDARRAFPGFPLKTATAFRDFLCTGDGFFHFGQGKTTRRNSEDCRLGRRGNPKRLSAGVSELIVAPRREHSRKLDEQYARIEKFCAGPYLELFARQRWPGWVALGNEVDRFEVAS